MDAGVPERRRLGGWAGGVASFQDGSAGSMLQDVRQYFIGVGLAKLNLGGSGGS